MKKSILLTALLIGLGASPALAASGPYISGSIGPTFLEDSKVDGVSHAAGYDTGYALNAAAGYTFGMARLEGAIGYQRSDVNDVLDIPVSGAHVSIFSVMANGYLDFDIRDLPVKPYVMAGLGVADVDASLTYAGVEWSKSDTVFATQVGAGVGIDAGSNLTLDIGYRYFSPSKSEFHGHDLTIDSHMVMAGLRYNF
ncbi:MAG: porin family protein [Chlorobiaceae bacterium]|nr:porin family protein [Chlorobiaceae bacterium]